MGRVGPDRVLIADKCLTFLGVWGCFCLLFGDESSGGFLDFFILLLFFGLLADGVKSFRHLSRTLESVNGVVLFGFLVSDHLEVSYAAIETLFLLILDLHLDVLGCEHFPLGLVDDLLMLRLLLKFGF